MIYFCRHLNEKFQTTHKNTAEITNGDTECMLVSKSKLNVFKTVIDG